MSFIFTVEFRDPLESVPDIFPGGTLFIQFKILPHHGDAKPPGPGDRAVRHGFCSGNDPEQGGFAAAVSADEGDPLALFTMAGGTVKNNLAGDA